MATSFPAEQERPYVELRCKSAFSFLQAASLPEALVERAQELGYTALALTDTAGVYGAPRFHQAALAAGLRPLVGAEVLIADHPLLLLCEDQRGYQNLCRLLTAGHGVGTGRAALHWEDLAAHAQGLHALSGGGEGLVGAALDRGDGPAAAQALDQLAGIFGAAHLAVELQVHLERDQDRRNAALCGLARRFHLPLVLTNDVRMAGPERAALLDVLHCIRAGVTLDQAGTGLVRNAERHLKPPADMAALLPDLPEAVDNTLLVADRCRFTLAELGYRFPQYPLPPGQSAAAFLRAVVAEAAPRRFQPLTAAARAQLDRELDLITRLGMEGYFLIVWDIIQFCRARGILVQGRGSAANSAVCFALSITACDPLLHDLLFERFLSEERGEWPDIDLDLPSGEGREAVIQYLYKKYGAHACALTACVISYRGRSAVRDVGKALGLHSEQLGRLAASIGRFGDTGQEDLREGLDEADIDPKDGRVRHLLRLCAEIQDLPRHLSQHPGGMIIAAGRLDEVVPLQPATMPGRVVVQWDKDDCAGLGLIKIDLLGLGMMAALQEAQRLCPAHDGVAFDLAAVPPDDPATYQMLQRADTIGVFQVESRAQMAVLPKLRPQRFYDLVVEVALIRPGPIIGKLVHPYLRRRCGQEPVTYPHPALRQVLERTLGVPLFQEQVMRVAMEAAGFSGGQADELRRAMGQKRSAQKMAALVQALQEGMAARGISQKDAAQVEAAITSFAQYGFPESHAISFALLTYASAYLKVHHPAVFFTALLNAWPMGFYHPATLVRDAQRHGVQILPVDVQRSDWPCTIDREARSAAVIDSAQRSGAPSIEADARPARTMRLGLRYVRGLRGEAGRALVAARAAGPFTSIADLRRRCDALRAPELQTLAAIGALAELPGQPGRREALWQVSALNEAGPLLLGAQDPEDRSPLEEMTFAEQLAADFHGTALTLGPHPLAAHRAALTQAGVLGSAALLEAQPGTQVEVAGCVIVRQRPQTAKGYFFLTLEDEHGLVNVIVGPQRFEEERRLLSTAPVLVVGGRLQREGTSVSIKGERFSALCAQAGAVPAHDFH